MPVLAVVCGLLIGLLLGSLGGGGSILAVPTLVYLVGLPAHEATTGALVVVGIAAAFGLVGHARAGRVRWGTGLVFGTLGTAGTYLGSRWSTALDPAVLMAAFSGLMIVVSASMLLRVRRGRADERPGDDTDEAVPLSRRALPVVAAATGVGLLTGFFGVGGGFVVVPTLTLLLGMAMRHAVATSLVVILVNSGTAFASRAATVDLDWPLLLAFATCAAVGSHLGNRLTGRLQPRTLSTAFASLVTVLAVVTAATSVSHL